MALKDELLEIEQEVVEVLGDLVRDFDRNYSEISEINKTNYNTFFTQVRAHSLVPLSPHIFLCVRDCRCEMCSGFSSLTFTAWRFLSSTRPTINTFLLKRVLHARSPSFFIAPCVCVCI